MSEPLRPGAVAVISGAASGIGAELARALHARGMRLVLTDIAEAPLQAVAQDVSGEAIVCDVSDPAAVDELAGRVRTLDAPLAAVFANAGVMKTGALDEATPEDWAFMMGVNVMGVANMVRSFIPLMKAQSEPSRFVATASVAGLVSAPMSGIYNATKHAVVSICETLFQELRDPHPQVGVSVICPGAVQTDILNLEKYNMSSGNEKLHGAMKRLMAEKGLATSELVQLSLAQLDEGRFWIFPQNYVFDRFRARTEAIFSHTNPEWMMKT